MVTGLEQQPVLVEMVKSGLLALEPTMLAAVEAQCSEQGLITQAGQAGQEVVGLVRQILLLVVVHIFQRRRVL